MTLADLVQNLVEDRRATLEDRTYAFTTAHETTWYGCCDQAPTVDVVRIRAETRFAVDGIIYNPGVGNHIRTMIELLEADRLMHPRAATHIAEPMTEHQLDQWVHNQCASYDCILGPDRYRELFP